MKKSVLAVLAFFGIVGLQITPALADPATIQVTPGPVNVLVATVQTFKAQGYDVNGNLVAAQPTWTWSVSGGGTIDTYGNYTAPNSPTSSVTVTATSGSAMGTATVAVVGGVDMLSGAAATSTAAANFTTASGLTGDWIHWGRAVPGVDQKAISGTAVAMLSGYTLIGSTTPGAYRTDPRGITWTDGTPTATSTNNLTGVYVAGSGDGFQVTCPSSPSKGVLNVYVGTNGSAGTLTAHLSSGTVSDYTNTMPTHTGISDYLYTLTFSSASAGQTLTVKWVAAASTGSATLQGETLAEYGM